MSLSIGCEKAEAGCPHAAERRDMHLKNEAAAAESVCAATIDDAKEGEMGLCATTFLAFSEQKKERA